MTSLPDPGVTTPPTDEQRELCACGHLREHHIGDRGCFVVEREDGPYVDDCQRFEAQPPSPCRADHESEHGTWYCLRPFGHDGDHQATNGCRCGCTPAVLHAWAVKASK